MKKKLIPVIVWVVFVFAFVGGIFAINYADSASSGSIQYVDSGLSFNSMDVTVVWNDDRSCKITQDITAEFLEPSHGIYVDIPVNGGEKIRNLSVSAETDGRHTSYTYEREGGFDLVRIKVGDSDILLRRGSKMHCVVSYDYITPRHKDGGDILALLAIGNGWTSGIEKATVTMTYPVAPENAGDKYGIWVAGKKVGGSDVAWSDDGKTVTVTAPRDRKTNLYSTDPLKRDVAYALLPYEGIEIAYKLPDGSLHNHFDWEFAVTLAIGGVLVLFAVLLKFLKLKNKPLSPIVDFYPPRINSVSGGKRHMLPVQMGKIIDDTCSDEDVTSLIFYWASEGYIALDERDGETYLIKLRELEPVRGYEKKLFDKIFVYGTAREYSDDPFTEHSSGATNTVCPQCGSPMIGRYCGNCGFDTHTSHSDAGIIEVSLSKLKGVMSGEIMDCKNSVNNEYRGKFYTNASKTASRVMSVLCAVFAVGISVLTSFRVAFPLFNFFGFLSIIPVILSAVLGNYVAKNYFKLPDKKRKIMLGACFVLTALLAILTSLVIPFDVMGWGEKILFAVLLTVPSCIAPFMLVREKSYDEQLNSIIGFRDFLRDAEKDRLETLLADDPQYYYNILPYANVLGVSDIWEKKFKDLTIEPPTYYRSHVGVFDIYVMSRLSRSFRSDLTYTPPSSSGSRSGGGSFGGFGGGGGFSGGSFGGGGGGRW